MQALDHDFGNKYITPFGILDLITDEVELTYTESKVTADFIVDTIESYWLRNYAKLHLVTFPNEFSLQIAALKLLKRLLRLLDGIQEDLKLLHLQRDSMEERWVRLV